MPATGLFREEPIVTKPAEAAQIITEKVSGKSALDAAVVSSLFADHDPEALNLHGVSFTEDGWKGLCGEIAKSMGLLSISFGGMIMPLGDTPGKDCDFNDLVAALVENASTKRIDLVGCNVDGTLASEIATNVIPWNKTILSWNFSDNATLGNEGVETIVKALHESQSSVQMVSFKNCGLVGDITENIVNPFTELTGIFALDFSENSAYAEGCKPGAELKKKLDELDGLCQQNFQFLHPGEEESFQSISSAAATEEKKAAEQQQQPQRGRGESMKKSDGARKPRTSMVGKSPAAAPRARGSSLKKDNSSSLPPRRKAASESKQEGGEGEAQTSNNKAATNSPARRQNSRTDSPSRQSRTDSPGRGRSPAPQQPRAQSAARSPARNSPSVKQQAVDEDLERWKEIKQQYNQSIRVEGSKPMPINRNLPKFVLGKRVDSIKNSGPSPSFKSGFARTAERAPYPSEINKLAPWNQKETAETPKVPVGGAHRAQTPDGRVIKLVNGGDITCIKDDPRDIGFLARKVKSGMEKPKPALFMSNSPRELRWGTTEGRGAYMPKQAQAPPLGHYKMKDEWEERAKKYKEQSRNATATGRACFGGSGAPRASANKYADGPGPGEYEIP